MLSRPTYAIVTVVTMGTLWLLGENGCYGRYNVSKHIFKTFCFFFLLGH